MQHDKSLAGLKIYGDPRLGFKRLHQQLIVRHLSSRDRFIGYAE